MDNQNSKKIKTGGNIFYELINRAKLIIRLMLDKRVNIFLKIIPILSIIYIISPFDFPGPLDDIGVFSLAMVVFVEACPKEVVKEHLDQINHRSIDEDSTNEEIIDAEFKDAGTPDEEA